MTGKNAWMVAMAQAPLHQDTRALMAMIGAVMDRHGVAEVTLGTLSIWAGGSLPSRLRKAHGTKNERAQVLIGEAIEAGWLRKISNGLYMSSWPQPSIPGAGHGTPMTH